MSAGNILITDKGGGILIDWDLSKKVKGYVDQKPRRHSRTVRCQVFSILIDKLIFVQGTWQFISVARLLDPWSTPHQVSDDLESFFWVLLYQVVRGRDRKKAYRKEMIDVFDQHESAKRNRSRGGKGKLNVFGGTAFQTQVIMTLTLGTPCDALIDELRALFNDFYLFVVYQTGLAPEVTEMFAKKREEDPRVQEARRKLKSSDAFLAILERHLGSGWGVNDDGSLDPSDPLRDHSASRSRRKRSASDSDDGSNFHKRRRNRMPPKSINKRSRNALSSQTHSSHGSDSLFSVPPRMDVSTGSVLTDSPRPSDESSSAKQ